MSSGAVAHAPSTSHSAVSMLGDLPSLGAAKLPPVDVPKISQSAPSMESAKPSPTQAAASSSSHTKSSKKTAVYNVVFFTSDIPVRGCNPRHASWTRYTTAQLHNAVPRQTQSQTRSNVHKVMSQHSVPEFKITLARLYR